MKSTLKTTSNDLPKLGPGLERGDFSSNRGESKTARGKF